MLRPRLLLVATALALTAIGLIAAPVPAARAGCITTLPAKVSLPRGNVAQAYTKGVVPVTVQSTHVLRRGVRVQIYTFRGTKLGEGFKRGDFTFVTVPVRMLYGVQQGKFTVVVISEPNLDPSCGPKHANKVIGLRGCATQLPVKFTGLTQGNAADYGAYYSFTISSATGVLMRDVSIGLYSFTGITLGQTQLPALFGTVQVNIKLTGGSLQPGQYSLYIVGKLDKAGSCGPKSAKATLSFQ